MKAADFNTLLAATNLDKTSNTVRAMRLHLVDGKPMVQACKLASVERQAVYVAIKKLPRQKCPTCTQWVPPGTRLRKR